MTADKKWKDYFLSSGLPLEYEVINYLNSKDCITYIEHSYLRNDENSIENSFSVDMDSTYINEESDIYFRMLLECKYRNDNTKWLFIPGDYIEGESYHHSFLHPNDYFVAEKGFKDIFQNMSFFAPLCLKGVEISNDGKNTKTINQAISQLSYAMSGMIVSDMKHQISGGHKNTLWFNIPIIATTANIYRMKNCITIKDIKSSESIEEVSTKENCIILKTTTDSGLEKYNMGIFSSFIDEFGEEELNASLINNENDIRTILELKSSYSCPEAIIVMHYDNENPVFNKLFNLFDQIAHRRRPKFRSPWRGK